MTDPAMHALESFQALPWLYLPGEETRAPYSYSAFSPLTGTVKPGGFLGLIRI
jgi:hypothetical protein